MEDLLDYEQPTQYLVKTTDYDDRYPTPVLTAGKTFILGYTDESYGINTKVPLIIFDDFTTANKYVDFPFKAKSSAMKLLYAKAGHDVKFVFEAMQTVDFALGDEHKRYWISEFSKVTIPVPCLEEQQKIASFLSILDKRLHCASERILQTRRYKKALLQQLFP